MTDDLHDAERALRELFADRAATVPPPTGMYAAVRRQVRQRRGLAGAVAGAVLVGAGIPAGLAATGSAGAPAPAPSPTPSAAPTWSRSVGPEPEPPADVCDRPEDTPAEGAAFSAQRDVRGSLGGDAATVQAVLRTAWARVRDEPLDPTTGRVLWVDRVDGRVAAHVTFTDGTGSGGLENAFNVDQVYVVGPDAAHLSAFPASGWRIEGDTTGDAGFTNTEVLSDGQPVAGLRVCGRDHVVVRAAPGSTAELTGITGITPAGTVVKAPREVRLRPDGLGIAPLATPETRVTVRGAVAVSNREVQTFGYRPPTDAELAAVVRGWSVPGVPAGWLTELADGALSLSGGVRRQLPADGFRAVWMGSGGGRLSALFVGRVPGGALVAYPLTRHPSGGSEDGYSGVVPDGDLDRLVVLWSRTETRIDRSDRKDPKTTTFRAVSVAAPAGTRAVARLAGGGTREVPLVRGGAVLPPDTRSVTVYDADGALLGERGLDSGLTPVR